MKSKNRFASGKALVCMAGAIASSYGLFANPVAWYRFDGTGDLVVNKANPGVNDATLKNVTTWGALSGLATYGSYPGKAAAGWPENTKVMDVKTGSVHEGDVRALNFSGDPAKTGVAIVYKSGNANFSQVESLSTFTCEAFVKVPDSASHAANDILFPIVGVGSSISSQSQGWSFCLRNNNDGKGFYPFVRLYEKTASATGKVDLDCAGCYLTPGVWHHVAFTANKKDTSGAGEFRIYLDYGLIKTLAASTYYGMYFNSASAFPLLIGADLWRTSDSTKTACFAGDVAEVRISDEVLDCNQMLAPIARADGPVDVDTLVYLPLGENAWFGGADVLSKTQSGDAPVWKYGKVTPRAAYPKASADVKGSIVRAGVYATASTPETGSLTFSRKLNTAGNGYNGHVISVPCDGLTTNSFTLEFSFRTDGQLAASGVYTSYTFLNPSWGKIMINQADGKLKTRLVPESGTYSDWDTSVRVDDGNWHHYALIYDKTAKSFDVYLDYKKQDFGKSTSVELAYTAASSAFDFGGQSVSAQGFSGQLDDLRITRGTLPVSSFLVNSAYAGPYPLDAQFEGNLASGQAVELAPDGVAAALGTGCEPTFADHIGVVDLLGEGTYTRKSTKCLALAGGYVQFPRNELLEMNEFTVEFFARFQGLNDSANLLRFSQGTTIKGTPIWTVFYNATYGSLLLTANYLDENGEQKAITGKVLVNGAYPADNHWHHWALVSASNGEGGYTMTLYRDYKAYGDPVTIPGPYSIPTSGSNLSIGGTGVTTAHITGMVDNLRFRPGVWTPSTFMRYRSEQGLSVFFR